MVEIACRSALTRSRIYGVEYVINPYLGCRHGCRYCYATFMTQYSRAHRGARWGSFVEVKANVVEVLRGQLARRRQPPGEVLLSSVCDPYQPLEARYKLTRGCLAVLREFGWGIEVLTRSPLVRRDLDLLAREPVASVGISIPTDDDRVRRLVEPDAPPIGARLATLKQLHAAGLDTWVFLGPLLPMDPDRLAAAVKPYIRRYLIDRMNYPGQVRGLLTRHGLQECLTPEFAVRTRARLEAALG